MLRIFTLRKLSIGIWSQVTCSYRTVWSSRSETLDWRRGLTDSADECKFSSIFTNHYSFHCMCLQNFAKGNKNYARVREKLSRFSACFSFIMKSKNYTWLLNLKLQGLLSRLYKLYLLNYISMWFFFVRN